MPKGPRTHGMSHTAEFACWWSMRQRCENPKVQGYPFYGARGIKVCDRWKDFAAFLEDMGVKPTHKHSIDRIDSDGHYEPANCRWATWDQQANNKRNTVWVDYEGQRMSLKQAAEKAGIAYNTVRFRIKQGQSVEQALSPNTFVRVVAGSGIRGAYHHPGRPKPWQAKIYRNGKNESLGYYETAEEAGAAYAAAKAQPPAQRDLAD
jgi:hypothetical protein